MSETLRARRVVEALRSGVPSAVAVEDLGTGQRALEDRFRALLDTASTEADRQAPGLMFRGGFGAGKSHLLGTFEHIALDRGYAAAKVVISKETPLHDPSKLLISAAEAMRSPDEVDLGLDSIARKLTEERNRAAVNALEERLSGSSGVNGRFAATLHIYTHGFHDQELADRIVRFWSGDKLNVSEIKRAARDLDQGGVFALDSIKKRDLALETLWFLPHLARAAGLKGVVLLIDEVELIGRYTRLQRGRAYAELARWLGFVASDQRPGLVTVAAISDDFEGNVLRGEKGDLDNLPFYMAERDPLVAERLSLGMRAIQDAVLLEQPNDELLRETYKRLKELHGRAYNWSPPDVSWPEVLGTTPMRKYVRAWINTWDVRRLYPDFREGAQPYQFSDAQMDYSEDAALSSADGDDAPASDDG